MRLTKAAAAVVLMLACAAAASGQPVQSLTGQVVGGQSVTVRNGSVPFGRVADAGAPARAVPGASQADAPPVEAGREQEVWEPTRALIPGDIVRQEDIAAHILSRPYPEAVLASQNIVGQQIKRYVIAGRPLTTRDVGPRTVVQASSQVTVLWSSGALKMEMTARAMESGALGDEIRILNTASGRTIRGIVVGDSMVEIRIVQ